MKEVLYIGPDYRNHRGGIGAVLDTYSANIRPFKFIASYSNTSALNRQLVFIRAVFSLLRTLASDKDVRIVHLHTAQMGSFLRKSLLMLISQAMGRKTVLHVHASMFDKFYERATLLRPYIRFILKRADVVVTLSEQWRHYLATHFTIKKLVILKNVVERPATHPFLPSAEGPVKLLFLGLIGFRKGLFDLLTVLEKNHDFDSRIQLTIGGNGEVDRLQQVIADNHPAGNVEFAGWVTGDKKQQLLRECDVYILPSYHEGLPISILEAMASGKPIISTTVGGIPEVVVPGKNGWLFAPGDLEALHNILQEVTGNRDVLRQYGQKSFEMSAAYTPEAVMSSLRSLYDEMLSVKH